MNSLFADGIKNVIFTNGIVKIEFGVTTAGDNDQPDTSTAFYVTLPLSGLMQSQMQLTKMIDSLVEKGVLRKKDDEKRIAN